MPEMILNAFGEEVTDYDDENPYDVHEEEREDVDEGPLSDAIPAEGQE